MLLEIFYDKLPKDCLLLLLWSFKYIARLAVQLADSQGEIIIYIRFQQNMLSWGGILALMSHVCTEMQTGKTEEMHYDVLLKKQCRTLYRAVFSSTSHKTVLTGVKVTTDFQRQCCKDLISVQCVNCSGRSESGLKISICSVRLQIHVSIPFFVHEI